MRALDKRILTIEVARLAEKDQLRGVATRRGTLAWVLAGTVITFLLRLLEYWIHKP